MLEPRRSQYLRALGIDVYVPRFILPGAAQSQPSAWESATLDIDDQALNVDAAIGAAEINSVVANTAVVSTAVVSTSATDVITNVITDVAAAVRQRSLPADLDIDLTPAARRAVPANDAARAAANATDAAAETAPKFALSVVVSDCGVLVVDDAPPNTAMRGEYLKLIGNILLALRARPAQAQLDVFIWPLAKRPQLDQSAVAARETLAAHINNQIQQHGINTLLLLGDAAQQWCVFDHGDGSDDVLRCIKSVSALSCLQMPQHKRQLWHDIQHLAAAR